MPCSAITKHWALMKKMSKHLWQGEQCEWFWKSKFSVLLRNQKRLPTRKGTPIKVIRQRPYKILKKRLASIQSIATQENIFLKWSWTGRSGRALFGFIFGKRKIKSFFNFKFWKFRSVRRLIVLLSKVAWFQWFTKN